MIHIIKYLDFKGEIKDSENVSGVQSDGENLLLVTDELNDIFVLKGNKQDDHYKLTGKLQLHPDPEAPEVDLEDIALSGNNFYAVGSHALARRSVKEKKKYQKNRDRLRTVRSESARNQVLKFSYKEDGQDKPKVVKQSVKSKSLITYLENDEVLGPFTKIPSKENGVDIEAIAADETYLYFGFRGPVLRSNYVPVMVTSFENLAEYELRYVDMDGRGIRGMTKVNDGFLLIGGPVGDGDQPYQLYFWNGVDCIPGKDKPEVSQIQLLGEIQTPPNSKAEGITVLQETENEYEIIIVYDGAKQGWPTIFRVDK
ncbi:MAG: DUF3616 domain-containing protein [Cyanobacteria bacterium P01_H01_bin.15]